MAIAANACYLERSPASTGSAACIQTSGSEAGTVMSNILTDEILRNAARERSGRIFVGHLIGGRHFSGVAAERLPRRAVRHAGRWQAIGLLKRRARSA